MTARIFRNGRSDAVRIPRAMALNCKEVELVRVGDGILMRPITASHEAFWEKLKAASAMMPKGVKLERPKFAGFEQRESLD